MNATHLHLILNHVPVFGTIFELALLVLALMRMSEELKRVAFGWLIATALLAVPVYLTGEPAEKEVSGLPGVSKGIIERHEDAAQIAFLALLVLGVIALVFLVGSRRKATVPRWMGVVVLAGSLVVSSLMTWTANLGGQVRHTEVSSGAGTHSDADDPD